MCGIAGIVHSDPAARVDRQLLAAMCLSQRHRGPDEWGMYRSGPAGIGMTRLKIIDLAGGRQPIGNEDGSVQVVFNGEIYNYRQLREALVGRGHRFRTATDTEVLVHLYEEHGVDLVHHLRGMFALAIWDGARRQLLLARDRLGIKPLHYYSNGDGLVFGSEIKSLLKVPWVPRDYAPQALADYLSYGYVPDPATLFRDVRKLPPGHRLLWRDGRISVDGYWDLVFAPDPAIDAPTALAEVERLLREAVAIRLVSDVPLGAFLSGGIDSSLVVACMAEALGRPVQTFSIGFENQRFNELGYARLVAQRYATDHHEELVRPDAEQVIGELLRQFDEPFADSSAIPTYYVARLARRSVAVALSGDGGDELFAGYPRYFDSRLGLAMDRIPLALRRQTLGRAGRILPAWFPAVNTLRYLAQDSDGRYLRKVSGGVGEILAEVFHPALRERLAAGAGHELMHAHLNRVRAGDPLTRRRYLDLKTYLPGDILTKVDRTSMLTSLEARVPLLDHRLAEFVARIPPDLLAAEGSGKQLLKGLAARLLPRELIDRPKMGFAMPMGDWINQAWREMSEELVLGERTLRRGVFRPQFLRRIMREHRWHRRDHGALIWGLMVAEMWFRERIDAAGR